MHNMHSDTGDNCQCTEGGCTCVRARTHTHAHARTRTHTHTHTHYLDDVVGREFVVVVVWILVTFDDLGTLRQWIHEDELLQRHLWLTTAEPCHQLTAVLFWFTGMQCYFTTTFTDASLRVHMATGASRVGFISPPKIFAERTTVFSNFIEHVDYISEKS